MKFDAELIDCLKYTDKKTGSIKTRLGYRLSDIKYLQDSQNFKGYAEMSYFCDGDNLFNKIKPEYFGKIAEIITEERPNDANPMRKVTVFKSIRIGNELISLL